MEIARFDTSATALHEFARTRGLMGRLTTPQFGIRSVAHQAVASLAVDLPEPRTGRRFAPRQPATSRAPGICSPGAWRFSEGRCVAVLP